MSSTAVAALVFGCTFAGALAGLALHGRLPGHHLSDDSRDVIKLVMGLIATVAALEQARGSLSWPFLVVLAFWLTVLFVGFGLFARRNATVVTALLLGAVCVAGAIFLILELNRPYGGVIQVSIAPIRNALGQMGAEHDVGKAKDEAGASLPGR